MVYVDDCYLCPYGWRWLRLGEPWQRSYSGRDASKLAEKDRELQAAQFNVGQCARTAMIVNQLRPFPQPAYTVANPYATPTATA